MNEEFKKVSEYTNTNIEWKECKGGIICFEGLDYSFKETNSKMLEEYIYDNITTKVLRIPFPNYESESAIYVKNYLSRKYGELTDIDPEVVSLFYALDRYDTLHNFNLLGFKNINDLLDQHYYIIFDRYLGSNLCFQTAKIDNDEDKEVFIKKQIDLELNKMKLPEPDVTIFMNMPIEYSFKLLKKRDPAVPNDIHESNYNYMLKVEKECNKIADRFDWKIVDCLELKDSKMEIKSKENLFNEVVETIKNTGLFY